MARRGLAGHGLARQAWLGGARQARLGKESPFKVALFFLLTIFFAPVNAPHE